MNQTKSKLQRLLSQRPLILRPDPSGIGHVCLHDAVSGQALGCQSRVRLVQKPGQLPEVTVTFQVDGCLLRIEGKV
jgi:hypothetical protein